MYIFINSMKNIIRHRKRYLISGIFMIIVLSLFVYAVSNYFTMSKSDTILKENNTQWVHFRFRDELQFLGDRSLSSESTSNISEPERNFVDDVMKQYNYVINADREYFDQFAEIDYVTDYNLGYMELVFAEAYDYDPSTNELYEEPITKRFALYGGAIDAYERYENEFHFNGITDYRIIEGEMYEPGECLVHRIIAEENGYKIGDSLTFTDESGNEVITLKISGIYSRYQTYDDIYLENAFQIMSSGEVDLQYRGLEFGSTPYNRINTYNNGSIRIKHIVFTDFDAVYNLYGSDSHEFDKYAAWYKLDSVYNFEEFKQTAETYDYDKNLGFYQEDHVYKILTRFAPGIRDASVYYIIGSIPVTILLLIVVIILFIRERKREITILYNLGCNKKQIIYSFAVETSMFVFIVSLLSIPMSWVMNLLNENMEIFYSFMKLKYAIPIETWIISFAAFIVLSLISAIVINIYITREKYII